MRTIHFFERSARYLARAASPEHADEVARTMTDLCEDAYRRGGWLDLARTGTVECLDLCQQAVAARFGRRSTVTLLPKRRAFGAITRSSWMAMDNLKHALRRLRAQPGSALLAVAMLGLAIGISSAMFTVFDALVLRPAPFRDADTFVWLAVGESPRNSSVNLRPSLALTWRANPGFAGVYAIRQEPARFGTGEDMVTMAGARITPGLMDDLGVKPLLGRTFVPGEGRSDTNESVILAETTWRTQFAADPQIVGKRVDISGASLVVVGVLPASFRFPFFRTGVWRPLDLERPAPPHDQPNALGYVYARLAANVPREDVMRVAADLLQASDPQPQRRGVLFVPLGSNYLDTYSSGTVKVLAASVGLVFLVLCVNVTNLMLARLGARRREFALCAALGASRPRLMWQAVWEQVAIGVAAIGIGLLAASGLIALARAYLPANIIGATLNPVDIDPRAIAATSILGGLAIVIAGVLPAWIGTRGDLSRQVQTASRSATPERRARRMTTALVVAEVALAIALSVAAGIQLRSFVNLLHVDRGFDAARLVTFNLTTPAAKFGDDASRYSYVETVRAAMQSIPGVEAATLSSGVPPSAGAIYFWDVTPDTPGATPIRLVMNGYYVTPEFFDVFGIRLLEGRTFQAGDDPDAIIVSRSTAAALWPSSSAVGRSMSFRKRTFRVIGVTSEIRNADNDPRLDRPEVYEPLLTPAGALASASGSLTVRCHAACPPADTMRAALRSAASSSIVGAGRLVADEFAAELARPRAGSIVAIAFAVIGLIAVGGGLFAVLMRAVQQRQREFGIRLALGATPSDLKRLVYRNGAIVLGGGLVAGVAIAWGLSRVLASVQYQVQVQDGATWAAVVAAMCLMVAAACWRPARRAMGIDPVSLLREE